MPSYIYDQVATPSDAPVITTNATQVVGLSYPFPPDCEGDLMITVIARRDADGVGGVWKKGVAIKRVGTGGVQFVGGGTLGDRFPPALDAGASGWLVGLGAASGGVGEVRLTGAAGQTITWMIRLEVNLVSYAAP